MRKSGAVLAVAVAASVFAVGCGAAERSSARAPAAEAAGSASYDSAPSSASAPGGYGAASPAAQPGYPSTPAAAPPPPSAPSTASKASDAKADSAGARKEESPIAVTPAARPEPRRLPQAGQLTAGIWDDNKNYEFFKPYAMGFQKNNGTDFSMFATQELETARDAANGQQSPHGELDVQLVLDTTGSMGDELSYLQSEFDAIAARVKTKFPQMTPRWSLVLYRDQGDQYVTRQFDFTTDTNKFRTDLRAQAAAGGGDTPEAVVQGLEMASRQNWRPQASVAKVAFWVADAPAHPGEGKQLATVVKNLKAKGVHVYPIASSDTDDAAEYQMRSTAQMTGGRYMFLTNDSGVGNDHAEPHIPCYAVTRLDSAILRSIETEMTGKHVDAEANDVIRNVGKPDAQGKCKLSSGALVASF